MYTKFSEGLSWSRDVSKNITREIVVKAFQIVQVNQDEYLQQNKKSQENL